MIRIYRDAADRDDDYNPHWKQRAQKKQEEQKEAERHNEKVEELYHKLKKHMWSLAYENNSDDMYLDAVGLLQEIVLLAQKQ